MRVRNSLILLAIILAATLINSVAAYAGQTVETEEGIAYALPDGWSVKRFARDSGSAFLLHTRTGAELIVSRYGLAGGARTPYGKKEPLTGGRTLEWQYSDDPLHLHGPTLVGRVTLTEAHVEMYAVTKD